jgi:hypothetical protein
MTIQKPVYILQVQGENWKKQRNYLKYNQQPKCEKSLLEPHMFKYVTSTNDNEALNNIWTKLILPLPKLETVQFQQNKERFLWTYSFHFTE